MVQLTDNEKKALIILFKDFTNYYNSNSLSKKLGISRIGCMKMLKRLEQERVLTSKSIGKSKIYKINLNQDSIKDLISFLLSDESNQFKRWKDEFKGLFEGDRIVMLYGSTIVDYSKARDIDLMVIRRKGKSGRINKIIFERQKFLTKKIHLIDLAPEEFAENLKKRQGAIVDATKNAIILYGQRKYIEIMKNATSI